MRKFSYSKISLALTFAAATLFSGGNHANAGMDIFSTFSGEGAGVSVDAVAMDNNATNSVQVEVPVNAVINSAYLYSASVWNFSGLFDVSLEGNLLASNASSRLDTGLKNDNAASENRWDVTSIVKSTLGAGPLAGGTYNLNVTEHGSLDGEILAVTYSVAGGNVNTVMLFDGELATTGDAFDILLATPFASGDSAIMSLGISFGFQAPGEGSQHTEVDVNGVRLTSSAGGYDDGLSANGGLITAGGVGDSAANPLDPYLIHAATNPQYDDELYNLASFLTAGDDFITIDTLNPSDDDNVFFTALTVKGIADVCVGPDCNQVPEPSSVMLLGLGLLGMVAVKRKAQF